MLNDCSYLSPLREAGFVADFVPRIEGIAGSYDKEEGLAALMPAHQQAVEKLGGRWDQLWTAEQVHGHKIAFIKEETARAGMIPGVDGLMTKELSAMLGIYVADCGLIWLADRGSGAVALLHSGRKGTEGGILTKAVHAMAKAYGSEPADLIGVLGPCIRPPHYEVDIAALIAKQAEDAGIQEFSDCGICTGSNLAQYYSYRVEQGLTGRMLGVLSPKSVEREIVVSPELEERAR